MTRHEVTITLRMSEDGDGFDADATCKCWHADGRLTHWVWSGWAETAVRAGDYAATEWDAHRTGAFQ